MQILIPQYKDFNTKIVPDYLTRYFRFPIISHHRIKGSTLEDHYPQEYWTNIGYLGTYSKVMSDRILSFKAGLTKSLISAQLSYEQYMKLQLTSQK